MFSALAFYDLCFRASGVPHVPTTSPKKKREKFFMHPVLLEFIPRLDDLFFHSLDQTQNSSTSMHFQGRFLFDLMMNNHHYKKLYIFWGWGELFQFFGDGFSVLCGACIISMARLVSFLFWVATVGWVGCMNGLGKV